MKTIEVKHGDGKGGDISYILFQDLNDVLYKKVNDLLQYFLITELPTGLSSEDDGKAIVLKWKFYNISSSLNMKIKEDNSYEIYTDNSGFCVEVSSGDLSNMHWADIILDSVPRLKEANDIVSNIVSNLLELDRAPYRKEHIINNRIDEIDIDEFKRDGWKVIPFISLDDARRVDEIKAEDIIAEYAKRGINVELSEMPVKYKEDHMRYYIVITKYNKK